MRPDDVRTLYDTAYAASYEANFLESQQNAQDTAYEIELVRGLLKGDSQWLDVACGTGYFLRRFPDHVRVGLDLSPAMLDRARAANPGVEFLLHDYRDPIEAFANRFDFVSCMWYAYCLVDTIAEMERLIENLAAWTAPNGTCFLPLADPRLIARCNLPYEIDVSAGTGSGATGGVSVTGILWNFIEPGGKVHAHLLSPNVEFMCERFERFFDRVEVVTYPLVRVGVGQRSALVATHKKRIVSH